MAGVENLVLQLIESTGVEGVAFDENGVAAVQFDAMSLNFYADRENDELLLFLKIFDIHAPDADKLALYAALLKSGAAASRAGCAVGIDNDETAAFLSRRLQVKGWTVDQLAVVVDGFLNMAETMQAVLGGGNRTSAEKDAGSSGMPEGIRV